MHDRNSIPTPRFPGGGRAGRGRLDRRSAALRPGRALRSGSSHLLLILFGAAVGLLMVEGMLRIQEWTESRAHLDRKRLRARLYTYDPDLEWIPKPGGESVIISPGEFHVQVRMNSLGFNDREYPMSRTPGSARILMLGDSFVHAVQVPTDQSMQAVLERNLASHFRGGGDTVEVINAGVSGYGPGHEYLLYQKTGRALQADLVLVVFCIGNDVEDESPDLAQRTFVSGLARNRFFRLENGRPVPVTLAAPGEEGPGEGEPGAAGLKPPLLASILNALRPRVLGFAASRLRDLPWIQARLASVGSNQRVLPIPAKYARGTDLSPAYLSAMEVVVSILRELKREALSDGSRFGVVLAPELLQVHPDVPLARYLGSADPRLACDLEKPNRALRARLEEEGIPYLDLLPVFLEEIPKNGERLYFLRDGHWNPAGHRVAAEAVERWVVESGLLVPEADPASH